MSYTYAQQKNKNSKQTDAETLSGGITETALPNSAMLENPGHQVEMPVVMREKMEDSFGMDLSSVKLYENKEVGEAGAEAVAQGSKIAFTPGKLDFSSIHGQALLGHEISHVASQARGEVPGSGLVNDSALEERADREGLMAARGESVTQGYGGAAAPLSSSSAASAAGPMQAKSGKKKKQSKSGKRKKKQKMTTREIVNQMYRFSAGKMRQDLEYDRAFENKKQELLRKNNGMTDESAETEAGKSINKEDFAYLDKKEEKWLQDMFNNPTMDITRKITERQDMLAEKIYNARIYEGAKPENANEDKGKLDLDARYSSSGTDYAVFDYMMNNFDINKKGEITKELENERAQTAWTRNLDAEMYMLNLMSEDLEDKNKNQYLNTKIGQAEMPIYYTVYDKLLGAASGKNKPLKRKKE